MRFQYNIKNHDKICSVLKRIASQFPNSSQEASAVKTACLALLYVANNNLKSELKDFVKKSGKPLSDEQKRRLKDLGLET
jgi:hypothetical protein